MATSNTPRHRLTQAGLVAGLPSAPTEAILIALTRTPGLTLDSSTLAEHTGLARNTVTQAGVWLVEHGYAALAGKTGRFLNYTATEDGRALAALIREAEAPEPRVGRARLIAVPGPPPNYPNPAPVVVAAHPAGGRVAAEEAVWAWIRTATRADLAGASHRLVEALHRALAEEGLA